MHQACFNHALETKNEALLKQLKVPQLSCLMKHLKRTKKDDLDDLVISIVDQVGDSASLKEIEELILPLVNFEKVKT